MALGLPPARLAVLGATVAVAATLLRAPAAEWVRIGAAAVALGWGSLLAWGSAQDQPVLSWLVRLLGWLARALAQRFSGSGRWAGGPP